LRQDNTKPGASATQLECLFSSTKLNWLHASLNGTPNPSLDEVTEYMLQLPRINRVRFTSQKR